MFDYNKFLSFDEIEEIHQRIIDVHGDDYLTPAEHSQLFNIIADEYIHDDTLFTNNI